MKPKSLFYLYVLLSTGFVTSCKKEDAFLNAKPNQALFVPGTLQDLRNLLHNENVFNVGDPALGEVASDDYYVTDNILNGDMINLEEKNGYTWEKQLYTPGMNINDWTVPYQQVYYANTVLDYLPKIAASAPDDNEVNQIKGSALFFRAAAFYNLLQTFALPYDARTATTDPGVPIRLSADLNERSVRASVAAGYNQVIRDLLNAVALLPAQVSLKTEPSKPAACAMLARVYLATGNYEKAFSYADQALSINHTLTDYNTLSPTSYAISTDYLAEDIFHTVQLGAYIVSPNAVGIVDSVLYQSYDPHDLRKSTCFILNDNQPYFIGTYDYYGSNYSGIANDEVYLIRAECNARLGHTAEALKDLNDLLVNRFETGTYVPFTTTSAQIALDKILAERRKELLFRGLRWTDLRRFSKESRYAQTLERHIGGRTYMLPPGSPRYAMPIPDNEIASSGIPQNNR